MSLRSLMLDATVENIRHSLERHMPISQQRDFYLWGISADNPLQDTFLYAMSVTQLINLSAFLLEDIVAPEHWQRLARYAGRLNTYFMYEIVSDDLAIGLSPLAVADTTYPLRRQLLYAFNYVMVERLSGEPTHSADLLQPLEAMSRSVSGFIQSMTREKHNLILRSYLQQRPAASPIDIEYAVWPVLVANTEICRELAESMYKLNVGWMIRQGLIDRYQSVTELLETQSAIPLADLATIGMRSILVMPTLAYYVGVLGEIIHPQAHLSSIINDGTLLDALSTAALIVRLLGDIGLPLTMSPREQSALVDALRYQYATRAGAEPTMAQLLVDSAQDARFLARFDHEAVLTRFHKDVEAGEYNVCLDNLAYTPSAREGLDLLEANLTYFSQLYHQSSKHLKDVMGALNGRLGSTVVSTLIMRFVQFYAALYTRPHRTSAGDYVA